MKPQVGPRYRSTREVPVGVWILYSAPSTGSAKGRLPANEIVEVSDAPRGADWVFARPERQDALEKSLVLAEDREAPSYGGYVLLVTREELDSSFAHVPGKRGEHPVSDILDHDVSVFSPAVDDLVRNLAALVPRYDLWQMVDWSHAPGNDDLEELLRWQVKALAPGVSSQDGP